MFNPEILSSKATHIHPKMGPVKEFKSITKKGFTDINGNKMTTVEIIATGGWASVMVKDLQEILK